MSYAIDPTYGRHVERARKSWILTYVAALAYLGTSVAWLVLEVAGGR